MKNKNKDSEYSFIYLAHCERKSPSSKRLWGGIGYGTVQVCILSATIFSFIMNGGIDSTVKELLDVDLITSASLLGLSSITKIWNRNNNNQINNKEEFINESEENIEKIDEEESYKD